MIHLDNSMNFLFDKDIEGALAIIENDEHINRMEEEINDRVILLIAKQQPVATDLTQTNGACQNCCRYGADW